MSVRELPSANPEDAQMLETRRFSVEDICRWFEGRAKLNLPRDPSAVADQLTAQTNLAPLDKLDQEGDDEQA